MSAEGVLVIIAWLIAIAIVVSIFAGAVAVAIVGPRRRPAVVPPAIATLICLQIVLESRLGSDLTRGAIALVVIPLGTALVQRLILNRAHADSLPKNRWVVGCTVLGLVVAFIAWMNDGGSAGAPIVLTGLIVGLVTAWFFAEPRSGGAS